MTLFLIQECVPCSLGMYQPDAGQIECLTCPLADKEASVIVNDQQRSGRTSSMYPGQVSIRSCLCASGFYHDPNAVCQSTDPYATCCSLCTCHTGRGGVQDTPAAHADVCASCAVKADAPAAPPYWNS